MKDQPNPSCETCRFWDRSFPILPDSDGPSRSFGMCSKAFSLMRAAAKDGVFVDVITQYVEDSAVPIVFTGEDFGCIHYRVDPLVRLEDKIRALNEQRERSLWQQFLDWFAR